MSESKNKLNVIREFGLSTLSVNNRKTVFVLTIIIFLAGVFSYISMPKESFPELAIPQIYIGTAYPGNSAVDMEKLITRTLEKEIKSITGVDKITSTSIQGYSTVLVEFNFDVETSIALRKVKDAVDKARSNPDFPKDLPADPNVFEMNFSEFPIMNVNLSGNFSIDQLKKYGEYLEDKMEALTEISKVDIRGVQDKEVSIAVDIHKMEALKINFNDIENALRGENMTLSGGDILTDNFRRTVRVVGEFTNMDEIRNVIVKDEKQEIVYLRDIAEVEFKEQERKSYAREFAKPVVMLDVIKRSGQNLLDASDKIRKIIDEARADKFPENLEISITNDQSDQTRNQVDNLENSIISGVILVVLVLLFFLGLRNALFVGIAIPLSMFMSFMILSAMGVTINMVVLFSLILALGMLVDNGIVVVENVFRMMSEGKSAVQAAKEGTGEVAWPIISSTATTLAAFLPLAFWPGMMGEFMKYLPITLMIVLGSSLFVGLVINPVLGASYMKLEEKSPNRKKAIKVSFILIGLGLFLFIPKYFTLGNLLIISGALILINLYLLFPGAQKFQAYFLPRMEEGYKQFVAYALNNSKRFVLGTFGLLILSIVLLITFTPKVEFFPVNQPNYINIFIEKPVGSDITATNEITERVEKIVSELVSKYEEDAEVNGQLKRRNYLVESLIAQVGEGTSDPSQGPVMGNTPHKARVTVSFVEYVYRRGISTADVMEDIRSSLKGIPGVQISVDKNQDGPPRSKPINIEVLGDDYDTIIHHAEQIKSYINSNNVVGVEELKLDIELGKPELVIEIDRDKARTFGVSTAQIAMGIRTALFGKEVSRYKDGEDDYPIQIRLSDEYRYNSETLLNQKITFRDMLTGKIIQLPISAVSNPVKKSTYSAVKRKDLDRMITISSNVIEGHNPNETVASLKEVMKNYKLPDGYSFKFTGEQEDQGKEMAFLGKALMIAIFLIFLIIVAQFNSTGTPLIIVASVGFSLIGVLLGLVIFQMDFIIIMTMIGIISLAGVVVNNAIVLIDYTNLVMIRKKQELGLGEDDNLPINAIKESIVESGKTRLRPVLLTAITTVLGLIPLATGMNINFFTMLSDFDPQIYFGGDNAIFWGPMSWTVIFGLTFATFLTLVIVPVMYYLLIRLKYKMGRR